MRDDFPTPVKDLLAKRAAYICSNKDCRKLTIAPSESDNSKLTYIGCAAHITAASEGGPRYDSTLSSEERQSIENGIYLCRSCADMIDKNNGIDYKDKVLIEWKKEHEKWIAENLNKEFGGSITEELKNLNLSGKRIISKIDRSLDLQKPLKELTIVVELEQKVSLVELNPFVFLLKVDALGLSHNPQFIFGNIFHPKIGPHFSIGGHFKPATVLEIGCALNPERIMLNTAMGRGNERKFFISTINVNGYKGLERALDLEGVGLQFYLSEHFSNKVSKIYFIVNGIIALNFTPKELEVFPGRSTLKSANLILPDAILKKVPEELFEMELLRFGRKGANPVQVKKGFPDIEPVWNFKYPDELVNAIDLSYIA